MQEVDHTVSTSQSHQPAMLHERTALRAMLDADPHNLRVRLALGALHFQCGEYADAAQCFGAALASLPDDFAIRSDLALALVCAGNLDAALGHYAQIATSAESPTTRADAWRDQGALLQRLGRLDAALDAYDQALACQPGHVGALTNRASVLEKCRRHDEALTCLETALAIAPDATEALVNKAVTLESLGRLEDALACLEQEIARGSVQPVVWSNAGVLLRKLKRLDTALACHDRAIALAEGNAKQGRAEEGHAEQGHTEVWSHRALTLAALARYDEALVDQDHALQLAPDNADLWRKRGLTLERMGRNEEAIQHYQRALALDSDMADAWDDLARTRGALGQWQQALADIDEGLRHAPDHPALHAQRGFILLHLAQHDEAGTRISIHAGNAVFPSATARNSVAASTVASAPAAEHAGVGILGDAMQSYSRAAALGPVPAISWYNRAVVLAELDRPIAALADIARALWVEPDLADARYARGLLGLSHGDFANGWRDHEARWNISEAHPLRHTDIPRWDGHASLRGKRILVWFEQGFGDTIQFCRLVPELAARHPGANVIFEVPHPLVRLCRSLPDCHVIARGASCGRMDFQIPLMSLPLAFGLTPETLPPRMPYLHPEGNDAQHWRARIGPSARRMRIGIACSGNPGLKHNLRRSIPLESFAPFQKHGRIFVLQNQLLPEDRRFLARQTGMTDIGRKMADFCDTAAVVAQMDLIISVDTSIAHLAGALAKPTWVVLPRTADWRWLRDRTDCPWYPSMRLFRNPDLSGWRVLEKVEAALAEHADRHRGRRHSHRVGHSDVDTLTSPA